MYRVIYFSQASRPPSADDIHRIVETSRANNAVYDVTGLLIYFGGRYFQLLEGPREAVMRLVQRIRRDTRHGNLTILSAEPVEARAFPGWPMGYAEAHALPDELSRAMFSLYQTIAPPVSAPPDGPLVAGKVADFLARCARLGARAWQVTA
jgi:hypothetical protein